MCSATKIIILFLLISFSSASIAQKPTKTKENAEAEAKAKAYAEAEARAKAKAEYERALQMKSESSSAKGSTSTAASVNAKAAAFYSTAMGQINTKHVAWIIQSAKKINERNLDELSINVMANSYGKNAGLKESDIEGLLVLLLRQAYINGNKEYSTYANQESEIEIKKTVLVDSFVQNRLAKPDSTNYLATEKAAEKSADKKVEMARISLTSTKPDEKLAGIEQIKEVQALRMQEITQRQQKISRMLSRLVNQVSASQESIIQNLK